MQLKPLIELSKCRIREFMREPSALFWVTFMPILWMIVLGFAFNSRRDPVYTIGVVDTAITHSLPEWQELEKLPNLHIIKGDQPTLMRDMVLGKIAFIMQADPATALPIFTYDEHNQDARTGQLIVNDAWQRHLGRQDFISTRVEGVTLKGSRYVDFLIPGLLGMSILSTSFFGIGMTLVANRRENLFKRYRTTPMQFSSFILSHIVGRCFGLTIEGSAILLSGFLVFGFTFAGSVPYFLLTIILGAAATTAIATTVASRTKSIPTVSGILNLIMMPMILLSGVFFPQKYFPDWLQSFSKWLPLSMLNDALRTLALPAMPPGALTFPLLGLAAYAVIFSVAAWQLFRWE